MSAEGPAAGGLTQRAKPSGTRIDRRGDSFDYLNLRAGDRVPVPARGDSERTIRIIGILVAIPAAFYTTPGSAR